MNADESAVGTFLKDASGHWHENHKHDRRCVKAIVDAGSALLKSKPAGPTEPNTTKFEAEEKPKKKE